MLSIKGFTNVDRVVLVKWLATKLIPCHHNTWPYNTSANFSFVRCSRIWNLLTMPNIERNSGLGYSFKKESDCRNAGDLMNFVTKELFKNHEYVYQRVLFYLLICMFVRVNYEKWWKDPMGIWLGSTGIMKWLFLICSGWQVWAIVAKLSNNNTF